MDQQELRDLVVREQLVEMEEHVLIMVGVGLIGILEILEILQVEEVEKRVPQDLVVVQAQMVRCL